MLKQMRSGAKSTVIKFLLFGLLLLAMTGLALMDVQGMFRGGISNSTIAKIDGEKITNIEFDRMVQNTLRNQQMKQSDAYAAGIPAQILRQEIDNRIITRAAADLGIYTDDVAAAKQIKQLLSPLVQKGMTEKDALQRVLQTYGLSEGQLVASIKAESAAQMLINTLTAGIKTPTQLLEDGLKFRNETRRAEYFKLTAADIPGAKPPTEDELKSFYTSVAQDYALPEYRTLSVIVLDKASLGDAAKISPDKVRKYYDDNIADYSTPETRMIAQVIAPDEETAKIIFAAADKTKNLQTAADAAGKGKGSYIKANSYTEKAIPVELSKAAFSAAAGSVTAPLKTPLGWHILAIEKITPTATKPFESVQAEIEKYLTQDEIAEALYAHANKIDDQIAGGKTVSEVAKENNIKEIILESIDRNGTNSRGQKVTVTLPLLDKVLETGFNLKQDTASPLIETPDHNFIIVGVKSITPSAQQPFDKVKAEVTARFIANTQIKALSDLALKIIERSHKGENFAKLAAEFKKPVQTTALIERSAKGQDELLTRTLFSLGQVGQTTSQSADNSITIVNFAERKINPINSVKKEDRETLEAVINRALKSDIIEQYRLYLMDKYNVTINEQLMQNLYAPKLEIDLGQ